MADVSGIFLGGASVLEDLSGLQTPDQSSIEFQPVPPGLGGGSVTTYRMTAIQNGATTVYWNAIGAPDLTGTGPGVPGGTLTLIKWVRSTVT